MEQVRAGRREQGGPAGADQIPLGRLWRRHRQERHRPVDLGTVHRRIAAGGQQRLGSCGRRVKHRCLPALDGGGARGQRCGRNGHRHLKKRGLPCLRDRREPEPQGRFGRACKAAGRHPEKRPAYPVYFKRRRLGDPPQQSVRRGQVRRGPPVCGGRPACPGLPQLHHRGPGAEAWRHLRGRADPDG